MARTPTKCKKKDDNIVINTPTKCKKGGSKDVQHHAATNNASDPQASTNGTSPPAAGTSSNNNPVNTKASGTNGTDGTIDTEADEDDANAKKTTNGTIDAEADEDDVNAKKTIDGTINADMDDNNADAKMMDDTLPYAQQTPQSQQTTNSNAAESDSTQANKVAPSKKCKLFCHLLTYAYYCTRDIVLVFATHSIYSTMEYLPLSPLMMLPFMCFHITRQTISKRRNVAVQLVTNNVFHFGKT
jgi:hypothetical protein